MDLNQTREITREVELAKLTVLIGKRLRKLAGAKEGSFERPRFFDGFDSVPMHTLLLQMTVPPRGGRL
jgi:hypothetical protein